MAVSLAVSTYCTNVTDVRQTDKYGMTASAALASRGKNDFVR